jgi:putative Ca2+/H+ antiporter (TMEM165/GDT1 family)
MFAWVLSLVMLTAVALLAGAWFAWRRGWRRQALLMAALAFVMLANVAIWTVPDESGVAPVQRVAEAD